jgi:hypothetical protein
MSTIIFAGINVFGLITMDPAMFTFLLIAIVFGGLNLFEFKRFD